MRLYFDPGSIIYGNVWKGYTRLVDKGICRQHKLVNHSKNYVDPVKDTCTNGIEGHWAVLKGHISKFQFTDDFLDDCLLEEVWLHQIKDKLWEALGHALETVIYLEDDSNNDNEEQETNVNAVQI